MYAFRGALTDTILKEVFGELLHFEAAISKIGQRTYVNMIIAGH